MTTLVVTPDRIANSCVRVLLCTGDPGPLTALLASHGEAELEVDVAATVAVARDRLIQRAFDVCLIDITWDSAAVANLVEHVQSIHASTQLLRLADTTEEPLPGGAGAVEIVPRSAPPALAGKLVRSAAQKAKLQAENRSLKRQLQARVLNEIVGSSEAAQQLREAVRGAADADGCVLIEGELGAECRQVAQAIHHAGRRAARPFLVLDCSVHSAESFERELLGEAAPVDGLAHGADTVGRLASGAGGTLLLENIQTLPITAQKKLAGIVARKSFLNPATNAPRTLEVRVMASMQIGREAREHRLQAGLEAAFGQTLVRIPPLRQRRQDISLLVESILNRLAVAEGKSMKRLTVEALKVLQAHGWPGNMCELEAVVERACALDDNDQLTADMLRPWIERAQEESHGPAGLSLRDMERKLIETTFARCRGNREQTARMLQIGIRTLSGKLREYGYPPRGGPGSNRRLAGAA